MRLSPREAVEDIALASGHSFSADDYELAQAGHDTLKVLASGRKCPSAHGHLLELLLSKDRRKPGYLSSHDLSNVHRHGRSNDVDVCLRGAVAVHWAE